jgi:hypothetical protein
MTRQKISFLSRIAIRRQLGIGEHKKQALGFWLLFGGLQQIVKTGNIHGLDYYSKIGKKGEHACSITPFQMFDRRLLQVNGVRVAQP